MLQRPNVAKIASNPLVPAIVALALIVTAATYAIVDGDGDTAKELAEPGPNTNATPSPGTTASASATATAGPAGSAATEAPLPGLPGAVEKPCSRRSVREIGVTDSTITIGQLVTDSSQIPQQFRPANEGLRAFANYINKRGGVCGRKLQIEYRNDNLNLAQHSQDMQQLADRVFAFVANESLLDFLDYQRDPPYAPTVRGGGKEVPDVGGLAFSLGRAQSSWHAGVVGSISPVLVGGGQYKHAMDQLRSKNTPCRKGGIVYLDEPTGASRQQAELGQVSIEASWGAGLGAGKTELFGAQFLDPLPAYEVLVDRMVNAGVNCVFAYTDLGSSINLVKAMVNQGVWPPGSCDRGGQCFRYTYIPLSALDPKFVRDVGAGSRGVSSFAPTLPLNETSNPAVKLYLDALKSVSGAEPTTFSALGFASGAMLVQALQACPEAPTRICVMNALRKMQNFTASGLLGGTTPFKRTRVNFDGTTFDWKHIFNHSVGVQVADRNGKRDFYRTYPDKGFFADTLKVARGKAA
jgi:hypothetical protein